MSNIFSKYFKYALSGLLFYGVYSYFNPAIFEKCLPEEKAEIAIVYLHGVPSNAGDNLPYYCHRFRKRFHESSFQPSVAFFAITAPHRNGMSNDFYWRNYKTGEFFPLEYIDKHLRKIEKKYNIPRDHIFLHGFSGGAQASTHAGPQLHPNLGGIISSSGWDGSYNLPNMSYTNGDEAIFLQHGNKDSVVPTRHSQNAYNNLHGNGYNVIYKEYDADHTMTDEMFDDIISFIEERLTFFSK